MEDGGGAGGAGFFNDLWKYDPGTGNWTWVKGGNTIAQATVKGTPGVPDPITEPIFRVQLQDTTTATPP